VNSPIVVHEYESRTVDGLTPSATDRALTESPDLRGRLALTWLIDGRLRIDAGAYVGIVELDCATIQVRPKLAGTELDVLAMFDYASGLGALRHLQALRATPDEGRNLRDLVCLLLTEACEKLLRRGLRRDYVRKEEALPVMRGRLLPDRQILRRYGMLDRLECRFDEFDGDILDNRLCAAALRLTARTVRDPDVRARARRAVAHFDDVCGPEIPDPRLAAERVTYHRGNEHYRVAHQWALLLLQAGGFHDLYSRSGPSTRAFMFDMNALFEAFVTRLLRDAVRGTSIGVHAQDALSNVICHEDGRSYTQITPDIRLAGRGPSAWSRSVDAKYKLYTDRQIGTSDLYQSFVYALGLSSGDDTREVPTACVVYGSRSDPPPRTVVMRRADGKLAARIVAVGLNVPATLKALGTSNERLVHNELLTALSPRDFASREHSA
jgi:5-methylcytosine-specific restriction enzyme subunit McrC